MPSASMVNADNPRASVMDAGATVLDAASANAAALGVSRGTARTVAVARFVFFLVAVWIALEICYVDLPMIRPGADIVLDAKFESLVNSPMFVPDDRFRVLVFGNSKTMAGFRPEIFDASFDTGASKTQVRSYNLGLPGDARFMPILKAALAAGNIPTHVLLTMPWDNVAQKPTWLDWLRDDETLLYKVIPFRELPRDAITFLASSHFQPLAKYKEAAQERAKMLEQRGWYFIKSQSFYPSGELPDNYSLPTDHPREFLARGAPEKSYMRGELEQLARQYHFEVVLIPGNMRGGAQSAAPPATEDRNAPLSALRPERVVGPDYWIYPPADFSDPVHLNPRGATAYTNDLARLINKSGLFD